MDSKYWVSRWTEGKTGFHQNQFHEKLLQYFPSLQPQRDQKVLVPLCGKSKDMIWLQELGLQVHGFELYEKAVTDFFKENELTPPQVKTDPHFVHYSSQDILISCGDFFKIDRSPRYDLVYDRAALVALPPQMRKDYAQVLAQVVKPRGQYLLITYEYDQSKLEGPPFSVPESEVQELYGRDFAIRRLESQRPSNEGPRLVELEQLQQVVYILERLQN